MDATPGARRESGPAGPSALRAAVGDLLTAWSAGTTPDVVAAWIEFAAGGCNETQLRTALEAAGEALGRPRPQVPAALSARMTNHDTRDLEWPPGLGKLHQAERAACLAARQQGRTAPPWALDAVRAAWPSGTSLDFLVGWADRAACRMLTCPSPVLALQADDALEGLCEYLTSRSTASMLRWGSWAAECVAAIETAIVMVGRSDGDQSSTGFEAFTEAHIEPLSPVAGYAEGWTSQQARLEWIELGLRLDVAAWWWLSRPAEANDGPRNRHASLTRARRIIRAVLRRLANPIGAGEPSTAISLDVRPVGAQSVESPGSWTGSVTVGSDTLMRALTGSVTVRAGEPTAETVLASAIWTHASGPNALAPPLEVFVRVNSGRLDPRFRFMGDGSTTVEPEVLGHRGVPPSSFVAPLDAQSAIITGSDATSSHRIHGDGRIEPLNPWPRPIRGEVPWSTDGSSLAWTTRAAGDWVMLRDPEGRILAEDQAPIAVLRMFPQPEGFAWVAASLGGLWRWRPGQSFEHVVETPPILWLESAEQDVQLHYYHRGPGSGVVRRSERLAGLWHPASSRLTAIHLDERGATGSKAWWKGWTATAFPSSDLIEFVHACGRVVSLGCYYPRELAWAGDSLLVGPWDGERLFFRNLGSCLEKLA